MKRFITLFIALSLIFLPTSCNNADASQYSDIDYETLIAEQEEKMAAAHQMAEAARTLGYEEDHDVIQLAGQEWQEANALKQEYEEEQLAVWEAKRNAYPNATYIWEFLQAQGYNDYVCAGIIGNIMVEVGGNTLAIQPNLSSSVYAGMCQWSLKYYPQTKGMSLEDQCNFLVSTVEEEFTSFGSSYKKGFSYESFCGLTSCREAALAFAKCYERCGSGTYALRQSCAEIAYNYFVS